MTAWRSVHIREHARTSLRWRCPPCCFRQSSKWQTDPLQPGHSDASVGSRARSRNTPQPIRRFSSAVLVRPHGDRAALGPHIATKYSSLVSREWSVTKLSPPEQRQCGGARGGSYRLAPSRLRSRLRLRSALGATVGTTRASYRRGGCIVSHWRLLLLSRENAYRSRHQEQTKGNPNLLVCMGCTTPMETGPRA